VGGRVVSTASAKAKAFATALERRAREAVADLGGAEVVREAFARHGLSLLISATFGTRHEQRWGKPHLFKPDGDNIAKLVGDCLMRAGALGGDDSRVSNTTITKVWGPSGSLSVLVSVLDADAPAVRPGVQRAAPDWLG
jgi:Holliday junction resolvase RusA-like endonuclease